jgi:hypothetical protein
MFFVFYTEQVNSCVSYRFYTSADLADRLLSEFEMTIVGTLTANRKGLPGRGLNFVLKKTTTSPPLENYHPMQQKGLHIFSPDLTLFCLLFVTYNT